MTSYVSSPTTCLTQTCPCGRPFSLRTPASRLVYNIAAVVVFAARRTTAFAGVPPPSRTFFPSSTRNLPHMTTMNPYSNRGKRTCVSGAVVTRAASTKVTADVMPVGITTPAPTTKVTVTLSIKVIVTASLHGRTSPQLPPPCDMALRPRVTTRTPADQVRFTCRLHLLRDGSKTVSHPQHCLRPYPTDHSFS